MCVVLFSDSSLFLGRQLSHVLRLDQVYSHTVGETHQICIVGLGVLSLQNRENGGNFAVSMGRPQFYKAFIFRGVAPPDPHQRLCPWNPLGALPSDPHNRLALCARHVSPN